MRLWVVWLWKIVCRMRVETFQPHSDDCCIHMYWQCQSVSYVIRLAHSYVYTVSSAWPPIPSVCLEPCVTAGTSFAKCSPTTHRISVQFCISVGPYNSGRLLVDATDEGSNNHFVRGDQKTPWLLNSMKARVAWSYNVDEPVSFFILLKRPEQYVGQCHEECCIYFYTCCCPQDRSVLEILWQIHSESCVQCCTSIDPCNSSCPNLMDAADDGSHNHATHISQKIPWFLNLVNTLDAQPDKSYDLIVSILVVKHRHKYSGYLHARMRSKGYSLFRVKTQSHGQCPDIFKEVHDFCHCVASAAWAPAPSMSFRCCNAIGPHNSECPCLADAADHGSHNHIDQASPRHLISVDVLGTWSYNAHDQVFSLISVSRLFCQTVVHSSFCYFRARLYSNGWPPVGAKRQSQSPVFDLSEVTVSDYGGVISLAWKQVCSISIQCRFSIGLCSFDCTFLLDEGSDSAKSVWVGGFWIPWMLGLHGLTLFLSR